MLQTMCQETSLVVMLGLFLGAICTEVSKKQITFGNHKIQPCLTRTGKGQLKVNVDASSGGCCAFVPFFPRQLGCCANRLYKKSTHCCCENWQLVPAKHDACASINRFWPEDFLGIEQRAQLEVTTNLDSLQRTFPRKFHCKFDTDACGWKTYTSHPSHGWKLQKLYGMFQETKNSYLHARFRPTYRPTVVYLISPLMHLQDKQCLGFWYYLYDVTNRSIMDVIVQQANSDRRISYRSRYVKSAIRWRHATIDLNPGQQGIAFVANLDSSGSGDLAIDDVIMTQGPCQADNVNCTFNIDLCGWIQEYGDKVLWQRRGKLENSYISVTSLGKTNTISTMRSPRVTLSSLCVKFMFRLNGSLSLQLSDESKHLLSSDILWSANGSTNGRWVKKLVSVHNIANRHSWLQFLANLTDSGHAAVDDVTVTSGVCDVSTFDCDFDDGSLCGWSVKGGLTERSSDLRFGERWSRVLREKDSSELNQTGFYIYFRPEINDIHLKQAVVLSSPQFEISSTPKCFKFSHLIHQMGNSGTLEVYINRNNPSVVGSSTHAGFDSETFQPKASNIPILSLNGNQGNFWNTSSFSIKDAGVYNIEIKITAKIGYHREIAVDDVMLVDGDCSGRLSNEDETNAGQDEVNCSFDLPSFCGWTQDHVTDEFDWRLNSGTTRSRQVAFLLTGPNGDHTTNNSHYAYISSNEQAEGDAARLISPALNLAFNVDYCFTLWHHIRGYNTGNLTVSLEDQDSLSRTKLWTKSMLTYDDSANWEMTYLDVSSTSLSSMFSAVRFVIEANVISYYGDIAIDDIAFHNKSCQFVKSGLPPDNDRTKEQSLHENHVATKPPLLYSLSPPSGAEVEGRFHTSIVYKANESRGAVALLVDASTSRCNQTGDDVINPSAVTEVESAKRFLTSLVRNLGNENGGMPSVLLTSYAGWQRNLITQHENLNPRQTFRRINAIRPMCAAGNPFYALSRASRFLRHQMTSLSDVVVTIVIAQSLQLSESRNEWRLAARELSAAHSSLSGGGRRVLVLGVGSRERSSSFYKSELSLVACGHVIHSLCDDFFFTYDVTAASEVASVVESEREKKLRPDLFEASSSVA